MSNRTIEAILRLSAKLGSMAAFGTLSTKLAAVDKQARRFNRSQMLVAAGSKKMHAAMLRYAAPALLTAGAANAVKSFASIERQMTRIGITAGSTADETTAALGRVHQIADNLRVPIDSVVDGLDVLTASGRTMNEALALLPSISASAHAAGAEFSDMATTADAIGSSFNITADRMQNALDILVHGGKLGKFELKDMAAELASLAPAFAALGYTSDDGLKRLVAMLQTVRLETGASSEAATAFADVLTKMESQTVVNNFKKFGFDLRKELAKIRASEEDLMEGFIRLSFEAVKGDLSKLPQLFSDKEMLKGMRALMNGTEEYTRFLQGLGDAAGATQNDLKRLYDTQGKLDKLTNSIRRLKEATGAAIAEPIFSVIDPASKFVETRNLADRALEKQGYSYAARQSKMAPILGIGEAEIERLAYGERVGPAYRAYAESRAAAPLGSTGPVPFPTPRPAISPPMAIPSRRDSFDRLGLNNRGVPPPRPFAAGASPRDAERSSMAALRSDPNGIADAIDQALASGGGKAAAKIADGGQVAGDRLGNAANAKIISGATDVGNAIGEAAAAKIRGAINMNAIRAVTGRQASQETDL